MDPFEKIEICRTLTHSGQFKVGESYPLASVSSFLTQADLGPERYNLETMQQLLEKCSPQLQVFDDPQQGSLVTLGPLVPLDQWVVFSPQVVAALCKLAEFAEEDVPRLAEAAYQKAYAQDLLQIQQQTICFPLGDFIIQLVPHYRPEGAFTHHFKFYKQGEDPQESTGVRPNIPILQDSDKENIYRVLSLHFPAGTKCSMAAVSKVLNEAGLTKEALGFAKMKYVLQQMDHCLDLSETLMGGVPQTFITLRPTDQPAQESPAPELLQIENLPTDFKREIAKPTTVMCKLNYYLFGEEQYPAPEVIERLKTAYDEARRCNSFTAYGNAFCFPLNMKSRHNEDLIASVRPSVNSLQKSSWVINFVGIDQYEPGNQDKKKLERFAFIKDWPGVLQELAKIARPECWSFNRAETDTTYPILRQYLLYTFHHLELEGKIGVSEDGIMAAFNTGLVTDRFDDIYMCFRPNMRLDNSETPKWYFAEFCTAGSRYIGKMGKLLVEGFNPLPQPALYFDPRNKARDLLYDLEKDVQVDYSHVIIDNTGRLPLEFLEKACMWDDEALSLVLAIKEESSWKQRQQMFQQLGRLIDSSTDLFNEIRSRIDRAIELAKKQVRWNYKIAIPCFYPKKNKMSFMLPLCLTSHTRADVALVVELTKAGNYQGQTILTLQMAYLDARLICRPDSEWLDPCLISANGEPAEEENP